MRVGFILPFFLKMAATDNKFDGGDEGDIVAAAAVDDASAEAVRIIIKEGDDASDGVDDDASDGEDKDLAPVLMNRQTGQPRHRFIATVAGMLPCKSNTKGNREFCPAFVVTPDSYEKKITDEKTGKVRTIQVRPKAAVVDFSTLELNVEEDDDEYYFPNLQPGDRVSYCWGEIFPGTKHERPVVGPINVTMEDYTYIPFATELQRTNDWRYHPDAEVHTATVKKVFENQDGSTHTNFRVQRIGNDGRQTWKFPDWVGCRSAALVGGGQLQLGDRIKFEVTTIVTRNRDGDSVEKAVARNAIKIPARAPVAAAAAAAAASSEEEQVYED